MYRGSCQALCEVSLLLSWKLFKNGPGIMFQIRFGGKKNFLLYCWLKTWEKMRMWVFFCWRKSSEWGQNTKSHSVICALLYPHMPENYCSFYTFSPGSGVKHQGAPMHTLHKPKNFERKDFWKSSAQKGWQNTMWDFPHTCEGYTVCCLKEGVKKLILSPACHTRTEAFLKNRYTSPRCKFKF